MQLSTPGLFENPITARGGQNGPVRTPPTAAALNARPPTAIEAFVGSFVGPIQTSRPPARQSGRDNYNSTHPTVNELAMLPQVPPANSPAPFGLPGLDASSPLLRGFVPATESGITPLGGSTPTDNAATTAAPGMDKILLYGGIAIAALIVIPRLLK